MGGDPVLELRLHGQEFVNEALRVGRRQAINLEPGTTGMERDLLIEELPDRAVLLEARGSNRREHEQREITVELRVDEETNEPEGVQPVTSPDTPLVLPRSDPAVVDDRRGRAARGARHVGGGVPARGCLAAS